jgi:enoyl-CoA hydratase
MPDVLLEHPRDGVAVVTLNRPESLNALTHGFLLELGDTLAGLAADGATRAVVLTGAGRGFCSGHGFDELGDIGADAASPQEQLANQRAYSNLTLQINELAIPVIAAVNGPAAGGGLAIALAADTRICSTSSRFNAAFVRLGISGCDVGVSYLLPRIIGPTLAFEMMLTGRLIDAHEALGASLVLEVVPDGEVVEAALRIAEGVRANSPFAVQMTKSAMWRGLDAPSLRHAIELEDRTQVLCLQTGDARAAIPAVREKRVVDWAANSN